MIPVKIRARGSVTFQRGDPLAGSRVNSIPLASAHVPDANPTTP